MRFGELVFEIGTEEIPSRFLSPALQSFKKEACAFFDLNRIEHSGIDAYGTPRRLVLVVGKLAFTQRDEETKSFGPPKRVAYGNDGCPNKAALGFAKREGVNVDSLEIEETPKGEYLVVRKKIAGKESLKILPRILCELIHKIYFPKKMRFESSNFRFVRPIRWILAVFDKKTVSFELAGVQSGNSSRGHRFLSPDEFIFTSFADFKDTLKNKFVILDSKERRKVIEDEARKQAKKLGGRLFADKELLDEVADLVEYPVVFTGCFEEKYLALPRDVLITSMKKHQKYFCVLEPDGEDLYSNFVGVSNIKTDNMEIIKAGNERVLRARLEDALFFFSEDRKVSLASRLDTLKNVVFQEKLGSVYDKVMRVKDLCAGLIEETSELEGENIDALLEVTLKAASLCKCDLVTDMVGEFPETQGIMGREYVFREGESKEVGSAIFEHYLPRFAGDILPESLPGAFLSISDKLDSIITCFGINMLPTGTKDPNGLRRAGLGIVSILVEKGINLNLMKAVSLGGEIAKEKFVLPLEEVKENVFAFLRQRMEYFFSEKGFKFDIVEAVLVVVPENPFDAFLRLKVLSEFQKEVDFDALAVSFKRVGNIIPENFEGEVRTELFQSPVEQCLFDEAYKLADDYSGDLESKDYFSALKRMSSLKNTVDAFFDNVMVMDKNEGVKNNRFGLLFWINNMFLKFADFSKLVR